MDIIKEDAFRKQIKKGLSGGYLFYGEEDYLKTHALRTAREAICSDPTFAVFNDVRMDALDYTPTGLENALMPPPMMADFKIVTVTGLCPSAMRAGEIDDLCDALATLKDYDYNILIISVPAEQMDIGTAKKPSAVFSKLSQYLTPVLFESITGSRLVSWVGKHFEHNGVHATPEVCSFLIDYSGRSMYTLSEETEKLSWYVLYHGRKEVTKEDVENICSSVITADAFALANAILDGRSADALEALSVMKFRRVDPVIVMGEVSGVICDLAAVKSLAEQGKPFGEIVRILKMNEYKARKYFNSSAAKSFDRLKDALLLCSEADLALKQSPQGYEAIERFICSL